MAAVPQDLLDRVRALERQVRELTGRAQIRPALNQILNGKVNIGEGGSLEVRGPNGELALRTGQWADGTYGTYLGRDDGTPAWTVGGSGTDTDNMVRMWARDPDSPSRVMVMDDAFSDRFLGRPWIPIQLHPTERQSYDGTTYQPAWAGSGPMFNAVARISLTTYANTGGGQVRVTMTPTGGTAQTVAEYDCPAGQWTNKVIEQPLHGVEFMGWVQWVVEHRNKSTGQNVETRLWHAYTRNTFTVDETPDTPTREPNSGGAFAPATLSATDTPPAPPAEPGLRRVDE
ncbi:hypothetical protein [Streptomyces sp. NPDC047070]|uniref:hypothetical protein n=1 Tax=Streptomyces sp. NPDC047070 TaxID=3154923 RepID=UPI003455B5A1